MNEERSLDARQAVEAWRAFATGLVVEHRGIKRTWADHLATRGFTDEVTIVQPVAFPKFAESFLDFEVGRNLAPEVSGSEGKPDFTPADALTHPFVFETKSTGDRNFNAHHIQLTRYLEFGRPRIRQVVVTNLARIQVFHLDDAGHLATNPAMEVDLRFLLLGSFDEVVGTGHARRLAEFIRTFSFHELDQQAKLNAVRKQNEWIPGFEITSPEWVSQRVDAVVQRLTRDAAEQVASGVLTGAHVDAGRRGQILAELRDLEWRLGGNDVAVADRPLHEYLQAAETTEPGLALDQFVAHTAYFATTRLLLVRIWEDLSLLEPVLYDGGFDAWMTKFDEVVRRVVHYSFDSAASVYPSLYDRGRANNYTWYTPTDAALTDVVYDLANTYLGAIDSDVLGTVYERVLERIDRKRIGQFYTPRDIIRFIWDLIDFDQVAAEAETEGRGLRVFDIATGSGGFLVEAARRIREQAVAAIEAGADLEPEVVLGQAVEGLVGAEILRFSAYLAEVNLLVQFGSLLAQDSTASIPSLGILRVDSMDLHEPDPHRLATDETADQLAGLIGLDAERADVLTRIKSVGESNFEIDVACGNPPYVGEKTAADTLAQTRQRLPYWEQFAGARLDLLYWFLILGVSKLRKDGRFGFITSEYWLRAGGAERTRQYLASRCHIERVVLLRKLKPFPDAPGHDSLIIIGRRIAPPDHELGAAAPAPISNHRPSVSIYAGPNLPSDERHVVLDVLRAGGRAAGVRTFSSAVSPNELGGSSWHEVTLTAAQLRRRRALAKSAQPLNVQVQEGVIATPVRLRAADADHLTQQTLREIGGPNSKHGIFVLDPEEIDGLGRLNAAERRVLRPIANTRDVLPYATVLSPDPDRMVYLFRTQRDSAGIGVDAVHRTELPDGLPAISAHMRRFETLLLHKVESYRTPVRRPWWEVHNHRPDIMKHDTNPETHAWADYALAARWGAGGHLVAGLAPAGSVPASGMQAIASEQVRAAYVVGVLNSTVGQELAEQMPPGVMQQSLVEQLPLPYLPAVADDIASLTEQIADVVAALATVHASRWPHLLSALRQDITLGATPMEAWLPEPGPPARWGQLANVGWIDSVDATGSQACDIESVSIKRDLFGTYVCVSGRGEVRVRFAHDDDEHLEVMHRHVLGIAASGGLLRDVVAARVPIDLEEYVAAFDKDREDLLHRVDEYRALRDEVDAKLGW